MELSEVSQSFKTLVESKNRSLITNSLQGSSFSLFIAQLLKLNKKQQNLIVVESYEAIQRLKENLEFFLPEEQIFTFPHWDILPYDNLSPSKEVFEERFRALTGILNKEAKLVISTPNALMQRLMPPSVYLGYAFQIEWAEKYERESLVKKLQSLGYVKVDLVEEQGEFAVRGEIVDIFPINEERPVRLDFFDDELETLKYFNIQDQRSAEDIEKVIVYPATEIIFDKEFVQNALGEVHQFREKSTPTIYREVVDKIQSAAPFLGIESLLPLYYQTWNSLFDYFDGQPRIILEDWNNTQTKAGNFFEEILQEFELSLEQGNVTVEPEEFFFTADRFVSHLENYPRIYANNNYDDRSPDSFNFPFLNNNALKASAHEFDQKVGSSRAVIRKLIQFHKESARVAIVVRSFSTADKIKQILEEENYSAAIEEKKDTEKRVGFLLEKGNAPKDIQIFVSKLHEGYRLLNNDGSIEIAVITEEEIFGKKKKQNRIKKFDPKKFASSLENLAVGDYVVHIEYGIGKFDGLTKIGVQGNENEFLVIKYSGGDKVYVPIDKFHLVQKFSSQDAGSPRMHKLGEKTWAKTKSVVRAEIAGLAEELVKIYATRKAKKGIVHSSNNNMVSEFALKFPYEETEDQTRVIAEVFEDMESERPMDRLVCGDVGFGKTEVAMRAASKAAFDGFQVGILAPTTILAQQHYESFTKRFAEFPVKIGVLSRFQSSKQIKETLVGLAEGKVDIVIGTHRLLSSDVQFKNLGLLVIDEEQRFGVRHKEKIKKFRAEIDVLALSATPIPRTLHMSLIGIRDISIISTPPVNRRAIRTRVLKFNDYIIKEAVQRELRRKGQIYFIHNRVESIYHVGDFLRKAMPEVRIGIAHGQMSEKELENVMVDFINHEYDILLATTIVESGLDIPNANTMIVNNADKFGLSQLYQLRGRVGRSKEQAYAYLLTPQEKVLQEDAKKRLQVLQELSDLGSGYKIASHDLELRGAGSILGKEQSGKIAAIGFDLYTKMVEEEVHRIETGEVLESDELEEIKIQLPFESTLPESYISEMSQRLDIYKSIAACEDEEELWNVRDGIEDRFGKLPEQSKNLFYSIQIKLLAANVHISSLDVSRKNVKLLFNQKFQPEPQKIMNYIQYHQAKPLPANGLDVPFEFTEMNDVLSFLKSFKKEFAPDQSEEVA